MILLSTGRLDAQNDARSPLGIAWDVHGEWRIPDRATPLANGDAIEPGALLEAKGGPGDHSLIVLLPDGQRIFESCFAAADCARGFRVPRLAEEPEPFAAEMLGEVRTALRRSGDNASPSTAFPQGRPHPRDEVLAALDRDNHVHIAGLASRLPNGSYTCDLRPRDSSTPRQAKVSLEKASASIDVPVPSPGLYDLTISDSLDRPRIEILLAAVEPGRAREAGESFDAARALLRKWSQSYTGWPIHEFQRAYLEALLSSDAPRTAGAPSATMAKPRSATPDGGTRADEPTFSPSPGPLDGPTAIRLQTATPGAVVHFTEDSSEPTASSPIYRAPIVVKVTGITIKAFASGGGKADSAVVTGDFRVRQQAQDKGQPGH